jgi:hypothetical protein
MSVQPMIRRDDETYFRDKLISIGYAASDIPNLRFFPNVNLVEVADQIATTKTQKPNNRRQYVAGTLANEQAIATKVPNKEYVIEDDVDDLPLPGAPMPTPLSLVDVYATYTGKCWKPRVLAKKVSRSTSTVINHIKTGRLFAIRDGKLWRIPSPEAHKYIEQMKNA